MRCKKIDSRNPNKRQKRMKYTSSEKNMHIKLIF